MNKKQPLPLTLEKPPLLEAVFEMRWELQGSPNQPGRKDPAYPLLYGRLYDRMGKDFPVLEDLQANQVHPEASPYVPRHRLRQKANGYPLIQVGPGILSVNDVAESYNWASFSSTVMQMFQAFFEFFPRGTVPLNILKTELRYLNAYEFDPKGENVLSFMAKKLHTTIEPPAGIADESAEGVALNLGYRLKKPEGQAIVNMTLGHAEEKSAILQQSVIQSMSDHAPQEEEELRVWLDDAHKAAHRFFQSLVQGELLEQYR